MPIDDQFHTSLKPVGKHQNHTVWGPGKQGAAAVDEKVKAAYSQAGQNMQPLGVHGTSVAVDWDDCIADGGCLPVCPVAVFEWLQNPGKSGQDDRAGYTDKSDPVKEEDCIFCMACVTVCPTTAIKVDQSLVSMRKQQPAATPAPAEAPSPVQQPAPAPAQQPTPAQHQAPAKQPAAQAPVPAQQPTSVQRPAQPVQAQAPAQPATQAPPQAQQPAPALQEPQQLSQRLAQLAQQLSQLAQEMTRLAQAQRDAPTKQPAAQATHVPQATAPAQEPTQNSSAPGTKAEKEKKVPDSNVPTN